MSTTLKRKVVFFKRKNMEEIPCFFDKSVQSRRIQTHFTSTLPDFAKNDCRNRKSRAENGPARQIIYTHHIPVGLGSRMMACLRK